MSRKYAMRRKSLFLDPCQGEQKDGRAFGFIGTIDTDDYCGWFFSWPFANATISTGAERDQVLDSLELDETCRSEPEIPHEWARQRLARYLRKTFDLRKKTCSGIVD